MPENVSFAGQAAIVTGAGRGLGRAYALGLARRNAAVVVNDVSGETADSVVAEIKDAGGRAVASYGSVASEAEGRAMVDLALSEFGSIDVVVHNAGILRNRRFGELTEEDIDEVVGVHLKGGFFVAQPAYLEMCRRGYGRIVFVSSTSGLFGNINMTNYTASKAGLFGLCNGLALEGREHGVLANCVLPKAKTTITHNNAVQAGMRAMGSLDDRRTPESVEPLVTFLASRECTVTGEVFSACLGRYSRVFVGVAPGWLAADANAVSPEDIRDHFADIEDHGFPGLIPESLNDELDVVEQMIKSAGYLDVGQAQ
jgi:NAD(P)-dependent dehydrogenase (short-subunit alcohol dehydrogenase family)